MTPDTMTPDTMSTASTAPVGGTDRRRGARRGRGRRATLVAATGLGVLGAGIGLGIPASGAATPRPIVRGKVTAVSTTGFTLTRGVATITVDVTPSTTYTDPAVSAATLSTLAANERVAVVGTLAGTNLVDATEVRILEPSPVVRPPLQGGLARLGGGVARVRGAVALVPVACQGAACRGAVRISIEEVVTFHRGKTVVRRAMPVVVGASGFSMAVGADHVVAVRLGARALQVLGAARGHRLGATVTVAAAGRPEVVEHVLLLA